MLRKKVKSKTKKVIKLKKEKIVVEVQLEKVSVESIVPKPEPITFENAEVIKVLEERRGFVRCEMSNGTTMDVPEQLFNK